MNFPINRILFPTDFSDNARNALDFALAISHHTGAELHLLHSIEEPYDFAPLTEEIRTGISRKVNRLFDELVEEIINVEGYTEIPLNTHIQYGRSAYTILEEADTLDIDMIIMGTRGRSGLEKIIFGSTTAEIVQQAKIPVLAVPMEAPFTNFEHILFTTEYKDGDLEALRYVVKLAEIFDSKVKVFNSSTDDNLKVEIMFRGFRELVRTTIPYKKIDFDQDSVISFFEAVVKQIELKNISLLVMVRYQKPLSLFRKKETKEMSFYTEVPLLMIPGNSKE